MCNVPASNVIHGYAVDVNVSLWGKEKGERGGREGRREERRNKQEEREERMSEVKR